MGAFSDLLLGGGQVDDGATLQPAQAPISRPAPVDQDALRGGAPRLPAAPALGRADAAQASAAPTDGDPAGRFAVPGLAPTASTSPSVSFSEQLLGAQASRAPATTPREKALGLARGIGERSLFGKVRDAVVGQVDPAYAGLKSFDEEMQAEGNAPAIRQLRLGALVAGDDARYGDIMRDALGSRFIRKETTNHGHDVIVYKDKDGGERKAYVNAPGLDTEDVGRGIVSALPYLAGGAVTGAAVRGAPVLLRAGAQMLAGASTSAETDVAAMGLGSRQGVDVEKAAIVGGLGAAGEMLAPAVGALYRRFVTIPGLVDKAKGELTERGVAAARAAGLDPEAIRGDLAATFAKTYAAASDAARAGTKFSTDAQGIPSTLGQRSKDAEQLLREKGMRYGLYGDNAKDIMQDFDRRQAEAVKGAAIGRYGGADPAAVPVREGVAFKLAPNREAADLTAPELGQGIRAGLQEAKDTAKAGEKAAWDQVGDILPHPDAMGLIPLKIGAALNGRVPDAQLTPATYKMGQALKDFMDGKRMQQDLSVFGGFADKEVTVDQMRRRLLDTSRAAGNDTDRAMAGRVYQGFNDWIEAAADANLLIGRPDAAAALRTARGLSRDIKDAFAPTDRLGQKTAGARILADVMEKADSPERIVSSLFFNTPQPSQIKQGSLEALQKIKGILDSHANTDVAANTWNDIRAAYWMRLVQDKKGEVFTPVVMLNNIKNALTTQRSVVNTLYSKEELGQVGALTKGLQTIAYKDPNPSGSGVAAATLVKQFFGTLMEAVGVKSKIAQAALAYSGVQRAYGTAAARSATSQAAGKPRQPPLATAGATAGALYDRNALEQ